MKHKIFTLAAVSVSILVAGGCRTYDDSSLWKQIDESQKKISELSSSLESLQADVLLLKELASGGVITSVTASPSGGWRVVYTTSSGGTATAVIAAASQVVDADIIGMKENGGVLCWTITAGGKTSFITDADGAAIPVSGRTPSFTVDKSGYWMVNGQYVLDSGGNKVKSSGRKVTLITGITVNEDGGVTFTFGDGSVFTAGSTGSLSVTAYIDGVPVTDSYALEDGVGSLTVTYEVGGRLAAGAAVMLSRNDAVEVALDTASKSIAVTIPSPESFNSGGFLITAVSTDGTVAVRPVYFTGSTDVEMENELWKTVDTARLAPGCTWYSMEFKSVLRKMNVLEIKLTSPVEVATSFAEDCVPNPNGNGNSNNGFCIRETLSRLCARKRAEGQDVLAGINTGFFDSNDGIARGAHIEDGELVYMPNPTIATALSNHAWALTVFKDNTASCAKKTFSGKVKIAGVEKSFWSVNDTILRGRNLSPLKSYPVNIYTSRYKEIPHASYPKLTNILSKDALYVVARLGGGPLQVNEGWADATVTKVVRGSEERPYLTARDEVAVQISATDTAGLSSVKAGDVISLRADMAVGGASKPIFTQNSTMWQFITDGANTVGTIPVDHTFRTTQDPMTFVTVNKSAARICLVQIDGRQTGWSYGVTASECAEIALHLGAWNATRFDGGGSSSMWLYRAGIGSTVSRPSDSKGERSCLNYIYIRRK